MRLSISVLVLAVLLLACQAEEEPARVVHATSVHTQTFTPSPPSQTPDFTPTPTPCIPNPEWQDIYIVQPNDTLGAIAIAAGVTLKEIQENNCLVDRDVLIVGQELRVPNALSITVVSSPEGVAGLVIFVRDGDLWTIKSDGNSPRQITHDKIIIGKPIRSPNLQQVAFRVVSPFYLDENWEQLPTDLWDVGVDGNNLNKVVDQGPRIPIYRSAPQWSPDSSLLAFTEQSSNVGSLVVIQPDGTERIVVTTGDFSPPNKMIPVVPAWSPDGEKLATIMWDENQQSRLMIFDAVERSVESEIIVEGFQYQNGVYWIADGIALEIFNPLARQNEWQVIDTITKAVHVRPTGLALAHPSLAWWVEIHSDRLEVVGPNGTVDLSLPSDIDAISWGPDGVQLMVGQSQNNLLFVDFEADIQQRISNGNDRLPAWTPPLWLVLP